MSHPSLVKQESPPYQREISFAPGECETLLASLGFDRAKMSDDGYLSKAIDGAGGMEALGALQWSFRELLSLPRGRLCVELMTRHTLKESAIKRDSLPHLGQIELAAMVISAECRNRFGYLHGELANMT